MAWWQVGVASNGALLLAYLAISWTILAGLARSGRFGSNPLALATGLIFFTCGVGHGLHLEHLLLGDAAARAAHDWHLGIWDLGTAAIGVWYWTLRSRFPALVRGAALFDDLQERRRQAFGIHDQIVQGIATAKLAIEVGDTDHGLAVLEATLASSRRIITTLLVDDTSDAALAPGGLRQPGVVPTEASGA